MKTTLLTLGMWAVSIIVLAAFSTWFHTSFAATVGSAALLMAAFNTFGDAHD